MLGFCLEHALFVVGCFKGFWFFLGGVGGEVPHFDAVDLEGAVVTPSGPPLSFVLVEFR